MRFLILILLLAVISFVPAGCSDDDDDDDVVPPAIETDIVLDKDIVDIPIAGTINVKITQGNDEYYAFSVNKGIATVVVSGDNMEVKGEGTGKTSIIVSDRETQIKILPVIVYQYDKIVMEKNDVEFSFRLGNVESIVVNVLEGNGDYIAESDDDNVQVSVSDDKLTISTVKGSEGGEANITITDVCERTTTVKVKAIPTLEPYTNEELADIMEIMTAPRFVYMATTVTASYYTYYNTIEDGMNLSGYNYYNSYVLKLYYPGDKSVGEKTGSKISYTNVPYGNLSDGILDLNNFKIIKNDGTLIWAVYSLIDKENVLQRGYFIQNINP